MDLRISLSAVFALKPLLYVYMFICLQDAFAIQLCNKLFTFKVNKTVNVILNSRFVVAALHANCESRKQESTFSVPFAEQATYLGVS